MKMLSNFKINASLLMPHKSPLNPWAHLQVKALTPSTHTPSFKQGFVTQSSISKNILKLKFSADNFKSGWLLEW